MTEITLVDMHYWWLMVPSFLVLLLFFLIKVITKCDLTLYLCHYFHISEFRHHQPNLIYPEFQLKSHCTFVNAQLTPTDPSKPFGVPFPMPPKLPDSQLHREAEVGALSPVGQGGHPGSHACMVRKRQLPRREHFPQAFHVSWLAAVTMPL